jgi:hypothetical protein
LLKPRRSSSTKKKKRKKRREGRRKRKIEFIETVSKNGVCWGLGRQG